MQQSAASSCRSIVSPGGFSLFDLWLLTEIIHSMPKTPEQWLEEAAPQKKQTIFKLFLGYAPGVGKTFNMLSEGIRRHSRGEDVVIGVVETHGRAIIAELAARLKTISRRKIQYKGASFEEMDVDAILARKPEVVLVDELAHTNIEGSRHGKRYEDVMDLLDAQIDVLSTMNVQHIESLVPTVLNITGVQVRETVPDWVMQRVNEIVLADLTPEALQTRMRRGDIYPLERAERALGHFFRPGNLIALRELALQQVTRAVDRSLESYLEKEGLGKNLALRERIAVCVSSSPAAQYLIARAARMAQRIEAELYVIYVDIGTDDSPEDQRTLAQNLRFAGNLGAKVVHAKGKSVAEEVAKLVREKHITQVVFGRSAQRSWRKYLYLSAIHKFLRDAPPVDVHIVTQEMK
jgi:two-component system sensor histidine kinase KdpD